MSKVASPFWRVKNVPLRNSCQICSAFVGRKYMTFCDEAVALRLPSEGRDCRQLPDCTDSIATVYPWCPCRPTSHYSRW
jgi:hypothetical protein